MIEREIYISFFGFKIVVLGVLSMASWVLSPGPSVTGTRTDKTGFLFWGRRSVAQVKTHRFCARASLDSLDIKVSDMSVNGISSFLCFLKFWFFIWKYEISCFCAFLLSGYLVFCCLVRKSFGFDWWVE